MNIPADDLRKLSAILKTMDIPELRRNDLRWLQRNIVFYNGNHERLAEALTLIRRLVKEELNGS